MIKNRNLWTSRRGPVFLSARRSLVQAAVLLLVAISAALPASAATFSVTASDCRTSPGGYQWAIEQANMTQGPDTISIDVPSFNVDNCDHPDASNRLPIAITESVDILGNGNRVAGNVLWADPNGFINPNGQCPESVGGWLNFGGSLVDVGVTGTDSSGIDVTISDLRMKGLVTVGYVRPNASLTIEGSELDDIFSMYGNCAEHLISAQSGADVTLRDTVIRRGSVPTLGLPSTAFPLITSLIYGTGGDLIMDGVRFANSIGRHAAGVWWTGGTVKIVNSKLDESRGLFLSDTDAEFVNSVYQIVVPFASYFSDNIILQRGARLTTRASTFYWGSEGCINCNVTSGSGSSATEGLGFVGQQSPGFGLPSVRFESTALGSVDAAEPLQHLWGDPAVFSSDAYTWVQPTTGQNAADLAPFVPIASTATPGLTTQLGASALNQLIPIIPGVLVEAVPNAEPGGSNELINPIDGLPLTTDVLGHPRVYANGTRNIGAVQNLEAPILGATPGDSQVDLSWSPTPLGQAIGYEICTSATVLPDPLPGTCPGSLTTAGPTVTSATITGLTNGSPYWFAVRDTASIWSDVATATPMGPLGIAQPTAVTTGDGELQVFWAEPTTLGGHTGLLSYSVVFRPVGTQTWQIGPQSLTARTTFLPGLTNGVTYEIGVLAQTDDGGLSPALGTDPTDGIGRGTPQAAPTLSYASPGNWPQNTPLTLDPTFTQLQGSGTYSSTGTLPAGMMLNTSSGIISGTPTTQESTSATIRLTDGATNLFVETTVPLTIVAPSPGPQLWYSAIQTTVGVGPVSATPTQANIPAGATFSVVAGESLPDGFGINATSGIISGTATTPPGQVLSIDIQACWNLCDPLAGEVRIAPALFYILPRLQYQANTDATAGVATTITPTVDLWSGGVFSIESGSLPAGMTLDPVTGVISGTPETVSISALTIRYSTGVNVFVPPLEYVYSPTQISVAHPTITLTYPEVTASVGDSLSVSPTVTGLTGTAVYSIVSGSLPQGLSLNPATGVITGVLTDPPGSYPLVIEVTGPYGSQRTSVVINLMAGPVTAIPTLSGVGTAVLVGVLLLLSMVRIRKRRLTQWELAGRQ